MEKYKVDYSEFSHFKGITIDFNYLAEGLDYAQKHNIADVFVRSEENSVKQIVIFDFLKEYNFKKTDSSQIVIRYENTNRKRTENV